MAIPTRFNIGTTPAGRFLQALQPQPQVGPRPMATSTAPIGMRGTPPMRVRPQPPQPMMPLRANMMRAAMRAPTAPAPQAPRTGLMGMMPAVGTPAFAGLGQAAATGLQLSGYRDRPITTGEGLGAMMSAGLKAYTEEKKSQAAAELAKQQRETDLMLKMMEIEAARGKTERESSKLVTDREMKRSEQFRTASKPFGEARLNYERVVANATTKNPTGATDIALIFNFMKMLDPTSVVRESEFQAAAGASPLLLRLGAEYNRLFRKEAEKLPDATRRQFFQAATETYVPYVEGQQRLEQDFISEAERFNLNPENVVRTKVPKKGMKEYPYIVYDIGEAENLPDGSWVMLGGELLQVSK